MNKTLQTIGWIPFPFLTPSKSHLPILHHHRANQTEHLQSVCRDTPVLCDWAGRFTSKTFFFVHYCEALIIWSAAPFVFLLFLQDRAINHAAGSHGVSGIFMKYDISSLMVKVTEQHMPLWQFLVRLCGIVGGIFSTTGKWALSEKRWSTIRLQH